MSLPAASGRGDEGMARRQRTCGGKRPSRWRCRCDTPRDAGTLRRHAQAQLLPGRCAASLGRETPQCCRPRCRCGTGHGAQGHGGARVGTARGESLACACLACGWRAWAASRRERRSKSLVEQRVRRAGRRRRAEDQDTAPCRFTLNTHNTSAHSKSTTGRAHQAGHSRPSSARQATQRCLPHQPPCLAQRVCRCPAL